MTIRPKEEFLSGEPGIYKDVPDEMYFPFKAFSNSLGTALRKSPATCKRSMEGEWEDTPALAFGSASHRALLESQVYKDTYRVFKGDLRSNAQKALYAELVEKVGARNVIREKDAIDIEAMQAELRRHRAARTILDLNGLSELAVLWKHEPSGLLIKQKIDRLAIDVGIVIDYKTTRDANPYTFGKHAYKYGYHRQGALYLMGLSSLGIKLKDFVIIAQERETPQAISVMRLENDALEAGRVEVNALIAEFATRLESGDWPEAPHVQQFWEVEGHDKIIVDVDIPKWAYTEIYDQEMEAK